MCNGSEALLDKCMLYNQLGNVCNLFNLILVSFFFDNKECVNNHLLLLLIREQAFHGSSHPVSSISGQFTPWEHKINLQIQHKTAVKKEPTIFLPCSLVKPGKKEHILKTRRFKPCREWG